MQKRRNFLVAATFEKANTYVFAAPIIRDREVGGSNPLAPTKIFKHLRLPAKVAVLVLWQYCVRRDHLPSLKASPPQRPHSSALNSLVIVAISVARIC